MKKKAISDSLFKRRLSVFMKNKRAKWSLLLFTCLFVLSLFSEFIANDNSRIETLTKAEKTDIALAFLTRIEEAGYTGMVYGNKEWLLKRVELHRFEDYDIWLTQEDDIPDYPYMYSMWQYTRQGEIYGIDGYVDLNIANDDYLQHDSKHVDLQTY